MSVGHLVMVAAGLVGVVATLAALRSSNDATPVAVAAHEILPGDVVMADDVTFVDVDANDDVLDTLVPDGDMSGVEGSIAVHRIGKGELMSVEDLAEEAAPGGLRAMSVPVDESRAVAGELEPGDRVDVLTVVDGEAIYAVQGAEVLSVDRPATGALGGGIEEFSVTVAVDDRQALAVVAGIESGSIVLARSTGASQDGEGE
ncbi:MAG: RcpC/CpaB family pilus assembly protein [Acidimicrobiia bacterium]